LGQFDNIGDVILRRQLATRLAGAGEIRALVGSAPESFVEALQLPAHAVLYRNVGAWYRRALFDRSRHVCYFFKPGEVRLAVRGLKEHLGALPLLATVRARGGSVVNVGVGVRGDSRTATALAYPAVKLANRSYWRDPQTQRIFGLGSIMPDLAFSEGLDLDSDVESYGAGKHVVVSIRGDRRPLSDDEVIALRTFAGRHSCDLIVAPQVRRDGSASEALANRLGARYLPWTSQSHVAREGELRRLYRDATLVVSNRLHVLIAALTEDASVALLGADQDDKIVRHLSASGIARLPLATSADEQMSSLVVCRTTRRKVVRQARRQIDQAFDAVAQATGLTFSGGSRANV
jgi:hypothetical protein